MRAKRAAAGLGGVVLVAVLAAILAAPATAPRLAPPAPTTDPEAWPTMTVGGTILDRPPGVHDRRLLAVTHGSAGFVAVGYDERGPVRDGIAWHAPDGLAWQPAANPEAFAGIEVHDVAAGGPGYVAIGTRPGEPHLGILPRPAIFTSVDGRQWTVAPDAAGDGEWYADGIVSGPRGLIAWGAFHPEDTFAWFSADGTDWDRRLLGDLGLERASWSVVVPDGDGWLAGGSVDGARPAVFSSPDGRSWATTELPTTQSNHRGHVDRLVVATAARIVTGDDAAPCSPLASCAASTVRWWSGDRSGWGLMPDPAPPDPAPFDVLAPAAGRGLVSLSDRHLLASPDGWTWTELADPAMAGTLVNDVVVAGDLVVGVGELSEANGRTIGVILTGGPEIEVLH